MSAEDIFVLVPTGVDEGIERAIAEARKLARKERDEADNFWRGEVLGEMPETLDEFKDELASDSLTVMDIAEALDATTECAICGEKLVNADSFEHAVFRFYDEDELDGSIEAEIAHLGYPVTDDEYPNLCTYHAHIMRKDD